MGLETNVTVEYPTLREVFERAGIDPSVLLDAPIGRDFHRNAEPVVRATLNAAQRAGDFDILEIEATLYPTRDQTNRILR